MLAEVAPVLEELEGQLRGPQEGAEASVLERISCLAAAEEVAELDRAKALEAAAEIRRPTQMEEREEH